MGTLQRRLVMLAAGLAGLALVGEIARRAVWGGGAWTDWLVPLAVLTVLATSLGAARVRPRVARWLVALNVAIAIALTVVGAVLRR